MKLVRQFSVPFAILIGALGCSTSTPSTGEGTDGSLTMGDAQDDAAPGPAGGRTPCVGASDCPVNTGASCASVFADGSNPCVNACVAGRCVARGCPDGGAEAGADGQASPCDALDASKPQCLLGGPCSCNDVASNNRPPICVNNVWQCPSGYTRFEDCHGVPPTGDGGECRDAASPQDAADAGAAD
jgi:hypothetical protein